jgi:hypothetical protein
VFAQLSLGLIGAKSAINSLKEYGFLSGSRHVVFERLAPSSLSGNERVTTELMKEDGYHEATATTFLFKMHFARAFLSSPYLLPKTTLKC